MQRQLLMLVRQNRRHGMKMMFPRPVANKSCAESSRLFRSLWFRENTNVKTTKLKNIA
jgi:hypothetical protein